MRRLAAVVVVLGSTCAPAETPLPPLPLDVVLGPGEVRCGPVTKQSELIGGPAAHGQVGRAFRCMNSQVRFIVQDGSRPTGNSSFGGGLVDVDRVRPDEAQ